MADNFIPMYKKSGEGTAKDILKLKRLEAISDGWYKGQLIKYFDAVFGRVIIDGVECYNEELNVGRYANINDNSQRGKDVKKLLKLLGLSDETLNNIYSTSRQDRVAGVYLNFKKEIDLENIQSKDSLKAIMDIISEIIKDVSKFELIHKNKKYDITIETRPAVKSSDIYTGSSWIEDEDYFGGNSEINRTFSLGQASAFSELKLYDNSNTDITSNYNDMLLSAIKTLLIVSGEKAYQFISIEKLSEEYGEYEKGDETFRYYIVESKETYAKIKVNNFEENEYDRYKKIGNLTAKVSNEEDYYYMGILANHVWTVYDEKDAIDNDVSDDLFYVPKRKNRLGLQQEKKRYLKVNGLKKSNVKDITFGLTNRLDFRIDIIRKKKKFLGIGGFIGSFLGGIFDLFIKIITVASKVLYYVPMYRLSVQFIGWVFSGKWSNDKDRFVQISNRVLLSIIAVLIIIVTGGGGIQIAMSLLTSAYGMYSGLKEYDDLVEEYNKQKNKKNTKESDNKLNEKLIDLSESDNLKDNIYRPFERINKTYESPFKESKIYSPNFGLKGK